MGYFFSIGDYGKEFAGSNPVQRDAMENKP